MIPYDPRKWNSHLFDIKGSLVCEILGRVAASVIWAAIVVVEVKMGPEYLRALLIPPIAHSLIGTALGLLLVFRTNSSYDRFWEGRKQWGGIVNECRNLARQTSVWLVADPALAREIVSWTIAFPYATMQRIRKGTGIGTVVNDASPEDVRRVESSCHVPLAVARTITSKLFAARERGLIDALQLSSFDQNVQLLVDNCGACERIRSTPLPFAYAVHLRRVLIVYCFSLPLALVNDFGWATIPTTLMVSYALFGIEEIGVEIEDPFGHTSSDLPVEMFCAGIEEALRELRDEAVA
jgi:ion channel-forming bestrophin family protein